MFSLSRACRSCACATCSGLVERLREVEGADLGWGLWASFEEDGTVEEGSGPLRKASVASLRNASTSRLDERDVPRRCCRWGMLVNASRLREGASLCVATLSELRLGPGWLSE